VTEAEEEGTSGYCSPYCAHDHACEERPDVCSDERRIKEIDPQGIAMEFLQNRIGKKETPQEAEGECTGAKERERAYHRDGG